MTTVVIGAGASATIVVAGTFSTFPVFTVNGVVSLHHAASGATVATSASVSGVLDMKNRSLMSGAVSNYGVITPESVWWALQPGSNTITNNGTGSVSMTYFSAWL